LARKTNHISVLQFDGHLISWLRAARSTTGVRVLDFALERGTWSAGDGSLETALGEFVAKHQITQDALYSVLPRHDITTRILTLPSQKPEEIAGMIRLSAAEFVPYAAEELVIDQCILQKSADGEARVLAALAHRDVVESHLQLLSRAGVEPERIYLSSACLASATVAARPGCNERYALVNLASGGLEALVINGQRLEYSRGVASAQDWSLEGGSAEEAIKELGVEVRASLSAYRRESEDGLGLDAVYLCSDWVDVQRPADCLTHDAGYECSPAWFGRDLVVHGIEHLPTLPLVALGAALTAQGRAAIAINLVPESITKRRARAAVQKTALKAAILVALILVALAGLNFQAVHQRMAIIKDFEARIGKIEAEAKGVVAKEQRLQILRRQVEQEGTVLELLAALCEQAPVSGLNFSQITFEHGEELNIWGRAETLNEVNRLGQALRELGKSTYSQFANAKQIYWDTVQERNKRIYNYAIGIPFSEETTLELEE